MIKKGEHGTPVAEVCLLNAISQATYFKSKKKYKGAMPSEMRRMGELVDKIRH